MKHLISAFFLLAFLPSIGQETWDIYNTSNSPLASNTIRCISGDNGGNLWVGTDNGLYSFDGSNWTSFDTSNSDIPSNHIRSIFVDAYDSVWVGTQDAGLAIFDGSNWLNWNTQNSDLQDDFIKAIYKNDSVLVLGSTYGLMRYYNGVFRHWTVSNSNMWSNNISSIKALGDTVLFGSFNGGLSLLIDTNITVYNSYTSSFSDNTVLGLDVYENKVWCATPSGGLATHTPPGSFAVFSSSNSTIPSNSLTCIDAGPAVSIGSYNQGLIRYEFGGFKYYNTSNSSIPDDYVLSVLELNNSIWIGTNNGGLARLRNYTSTTSYDDINSEIHVRDELIVAKSTGPFILRIFSIDGRQMYSGSFVDYASIPFSSETSGVFVIELISNRGERLVRKFYK